MHTGPKRPKIAHQYIFLIEDTYLQKSKIPVVLETIEICIFQVPMLLFYFTLGLLLFILIQASLMDEFFPF